MKKKWVFLSILLLIVMTVSGCGQVLVALGGADAVILQSEIAIDEKIGLSYEGKTIHTLLEQGEEPWEYRVEGKTDYQFSPYVIYVSGIEDDEPLEYYIIGDERYEKVDSNEWDKIALADEGEEEEWQDWIDLEDPRTSLDFLSDAGEKTTMEKKEDTYILKAELSGEEMKKRMKEYHDELIYYAAEWYADDDEIETAKLLKMKHQVWFDRKTYLPKKFSSNLEIELEIEGSPAKMTLETEFTLKEALEKKIAIPKEIQEMTD